MHPLLATSARLELDTTFVGREVCRTPRPRAARFPVPHGRRCVEENNVEVAWSEWFGPMVKGARPACPALRNMARDVTFQVVILLLLATSLAFGSDGWDFRGRVLWGAPGQGGPAVPALPSGSGGSGPGSLGYGGPPPALAELQTFARSVPADPASQLRSRPLGLYSTTPTSPPPSPLDLQSIVASYDAAQQQPGVPGAFRVPSGPLPPPPTGT